MKRAIVTFIAISTLIVLPRYYAEELPPMSTYSVQQSSSPATSTNTNNPNDEPKGPNTATLDKGRGNWLKKRQWLLRAKEENRKIQEDVTACNQKKAPLLKEYNGIQSFLKEFYNEISQRLEKLRINAQRLLQTEEIATAKKENITVAEEKKIEQSLPSFEEFDEQAELQKRIQGFPEELTSVKQLDEAISKRIEKLDEELESIHSDSERAHMLYEEMWELLDDQKAQTYFYQLKNIRAHVKSIREYLETDFSLDFNATIATTKEQSEKSKEKLLDLEASLKSFEKAQEEKEQQRIAALKKKPQSNQKWFIAYPKKIVETVTSFFSMLLETIRSYFTKK